MSWRDRWSSRRRPAPSRWTTGGGGGPGCPGRTGGTRADLAPRCTASSGTRWCTSRARTPPRTPRGRASASPPRPSGSTPRAGGAMTTYPWGEELEVRGRPMANTFRGDFPWRHEDARGAGTSAVGSYPPNGHGLVDMIGNVWEWTGSGVDRRPHARRPAVHPHCRRRGRTRGGSPRVARTCARRRTAGATVPRPARGRRWRAAPATSVSAASATPEGPTLVPWSLGTRRSRRRRCGSAAPTTGCGWPGRGTARARRCSSCRAG